MFLIVLWTQTVLDHLLVCWASEVAQSGGCGLVSRVWLVACFQESEIHQKCIRPPPNRTVLESESPPPYRSSSAGLLGSSSSSSSSSSGGGGDWSGGGSAPLVVRCHSMSSSSTTSSSKRPEAGSSGQKTDFLHRTVKIFTGGKKGTGGGGGTPTPVQTLPVVIVPTRPRRTSGEQQGAAATTRSKPSVWPHVSTPRWLCEFIV